MARARFIAVGAVVLGAVAAAGTALAQPPPPQPPTPPVQLGASPPPLPPLPPLPQNTGTGLTMDQAVAIAVQRNRDIIAARLEIDVAQVERIAAGLYPNPILFYTAGNLVIPPGNAQGQNLSPGPFSQIVHTIGVSEVIDVWAKRSYRMRSADVGIEWKKLRVEDVLREVAFNVRVAFTDLVREQEEHELVRTMKTRYDETVRRARARVAAGEISPAEGMKFELEGLKYDNAVIDSEMQLELARRELATLLALPGTAELGGTAVPPPTGAPRSVPTIEPLLARAFQERPDLRAAIKERQMGDAALSREEREAYPDVALGLAYTHSEFTVSGDNANALAVTLSMPLPIFDRNQGGIARARVDLARNQNDRTRIELEIRHEVGEAVRRADRGAHLLDIYEAGGMLTRADNALRAAESSYSAGQTSQLELLEAQRTLIETRMQYLQARDDYRKAMISISHAVGERVQ